MAALNEITVSSLLWSSGTETIGVMIYAMHYEGNSPQAAAISMISFLIVLTIALTISHLGKSLPEGVIPWRS
jgi:iron(III) transport system permease protein